MNDHLPVTFKRISPLCGVTCFNRLSQEAEMKLRHTYSDLVVQAQMGPVVFSCLQAAYILSICLCITAISYAQKITLAF